MWFDVSHYWNFGASIGILLYEVVAHIRIVIVVFGLWNLVHLGQLSLADAWRILLDQLGITLPHLAPDLINQSVGTAL